MKKTIFSMFALVFVMFQTVNTHAQFTFTADLELVFRDTTRHFVMNYNDTMQFGFSVINHGPDDIDTSNFILYGMTDIPPQYFLVVQNDAGGLQLLNHGDTINDRGITFVHNVEFAADSTFEYCYFLRTNEDPFEFIFDPNQQNDTICFSVTFKKAATSIIGTAAMSATLLIMPNPATDYVNIPLNHLQDKQALVTVTGIDGRIVYSERIERLKANARQLHVASWPKGMYMVTITSEGMRQAGKFVVR